MRSKLLSLILIFLSCHKEITPKLFYSIGDVKSGETNFSTGGKSIAVISFPNHLGRCIIKLYPESSVSFSYAYVRLKKITVNISSYNGMIFLLSQDCNIKVGEDMNCDECEAFLKDKSFEVIEGKMKYKDIFIRKGFGYIPSERRMYALKPKINPVFPRDKQEVTIPLFLWEKRDDVEKYFIELSLDPEFLNPIYCVTTEENKFFPDQMTLKIFSRRIYWRIIYEDKYGIGGFPSSPQEMIIP